MKIFRLKQVYNTLMWWLHNDNHIIINYILGRYYLYFQWSAIYLHKITATNAYELIMGLLYTNQIQQHVERVNFQTSIDLWASKRDAKLESIYEVVKYEMSRKKLLKNWMDFF